MIKVCIENIIKISRIDHRLVLDCENIYDDLLKSNIRLII